MNPPAERRVKAHELSDSTLRESFQIDRAMQRGVRKAREENRRLGIPNVSVRDGRVIEELPDGSVHPVDDARAELPADEKKRRAS